MKTSPSSAATSSRSPIWRDWRALRIGNEIDEALKARFAYRPGLPEALFSGARVVEFVQACCEQHANAD